MDTLTADRLAEVLQEPNRDLLARVLKRLGAERCAQVLADTLTTEANGGMLIRSGTRRRTPGGTFFQLVRDRATVKERYFIFQPERTPVKHPGQKAPTSTTPDTPVILTLDLWKGLTPMPVTATLKLVLRDLPETRESGGMVYMALHNEPRGLPKGINLDSGPLYLTSPGAAVAHSLYQGRRDTRY